LAQPVAMGLVSRVTEVVMGAEYVVRVITGGAGVVVTGLHEMVTFG